MPPLGFGLRAGGWAARAWELAMRINNNNPLDPFFVTEAAKSRVSRSDDTKTDRNAADSPDAGQVQSLVRQALAAPDFRTEAVADAKRLLETGQLESDQAIDRLAERLTDQGI
jgi:hypothetical protein